MSGQRDFVFRFDASHAAGAGHFMRQLALAQAAAKHGRATMLMPDEAAPLVGFLPSGVGSEPLPPMSSEDEVAWLTERFLGGIFFIDSYLLPADYYAVLSSKAFVVAFEDGERPLSAQIIVKPRPKDGGSPRAELLEGCEYIPVRPDFTSRGELPSTPRRERRPRLLICLGASDPTGSLSDVLLALPASAARGFALTIVTGPLAGEQRLPLAELTRRGWSFELVRNPDMAALMASTDAAIVAAGSIVWELACLAVPTLAVALVPNQDRNAQLLGRMGCIADGNQLDEFLSNPALRRQLGSRLRALVDGRGAERVIDAAIARVS